MSDSPAMEPIRRQSASVTQIHSSMSKVSSQATASTLSTQVSGIANSLASGISSALGGESKQQEAKEPEKKASQWRSAIDHSTNRTYYYDTVTRQTQWRKPLELCSAEERREIEEKETVQKNFFAEMEANVLRNIQKGDATGARLDEELRRRRDSDTNAGHGEGEE
ncbi:hypothetical protein TeGR_g12448, partial [Tetraparma gracilis]